MVKLPYNGLLLFSSRTAVARPDVGKSPWTLGGLALLVCVATLTVGCGDDGTTPVATAADIRLNEVDTEDSASADVDEPLDDTSDFEIVDATSDTTSDIADVVSDIDSPDITTPPELPLEAAIVTQTTTEAYAWVGVVSPTVLVASDDTAWWWLGGPDPLAVNVPTDSDLVLPPLDAAPAIAVVADDEVLLGGPAGLSRIRNGELLGGPLVERFSGEAITSMVVERLTPTVDFWISSDDGLKRWQDGVLRPFTATGIDFISNLLAFGAPFAPENDPAIAPIIPPAPALWLAGAHGVSALRVSAVPPTLGLERPDLGDAPVSALGTNREGHLYALTDNTLHVRLPATGRGQWLEVELPAAPLRLAANRESAAVWVLLVDGTLVRGSGTAFARVAPLPAAIATASALALHADGRLVAATAEGLYEISASRTVTIGNIPTSNPVRSVTTVTIRASDPDAITGVTATIRSGGETVATPDVSIDNSGPTRLITLTLDPFTIPNGQARLDVSVNYADTDAIAASALFTIDFPTWDRDVEGVYTSLCSNCHGPDNGGNFASLETPDAWSGRIDNILCRIDVHSGSKAPECGTLGFDVASMPPGRTVTSERVEMLRLWREAGFRP